MKNVLFLLSISIISFTSNAQCTIGNYQSTYTILPIDYPYTNSNGVTVSNGGAILQTVTPAITYKCSTDSFTAGSPTFAVNGSVDTLVLIFSQPINNFSFIYSSAEKNEVIKVTSNTGVCALSNYCTQYFDTTIFSNQLKTKISTNGFVSATLVSVTARECATKFIIKHNTFSQGAIISLLDCFGGNCTPLAITDLQYTKPTTKKYYNIFGQKVDIENCPIGIYIVKENSKTYKIYK